MYSCWHFPQVIYKFILNIHLLTLCINIYTYVCMYVWIYVCVHTLCIYVYIYVCIYICTYIHIYLITYVPISVWMCLCICVCVYMCLCVHTYMCMYIIIMYMYLCVYCIPLPNWHIDLHTACIHAPYIIHICLLRGVEPVNLVRLLLRVCRSFHGDL